MNSLTMLQYFNFRLLFVLLFLPFGFLQAQDRSEKLLRKQLENARYNEKAAEDLLAYFESYQPESALHIAFKATTYAVMCIHDNNIFRRLKLCKEAVSLADRAVSIDKDNLEVRFVRYAIQSEIPGILGMSDNLKEDIQFLKTHFNQKQFSNIPFGSLEEMLAMMDESDDFSDEEILAMKAELYQL